ncbi:hypothetical protein AGR1B_pAt30030 [Agrobacterium fabacearum S56]|nr:hypothetical protein AGR1B_pAt30030 [Agrobacterium fabacearum S56]
MSDCKPVYRSAPQSAALHSRGSDRQLTTCPKHILLTGAQAKSCKNDPFVGMMAADGLSDSISAKMASRSYRADAEQVSFTTCVPLL